MVMAQPLGYGLNNTDHTDSLISGRKIWMTRTFPPAETPSNTWQTPGEIRAGGDSCNLRNQMRYGEMRCNESGKCIKSEIEEMR